MWRYTALPVKVAVLDARACFPVLIFVLYLELDHGVHRDRRDRLLHRDQLVRPDRARRVAADASGAGRLRAPRRSGLEAAATGMSRE